MAEWTNSPFFGVALSVAAFWIGVQLQKKTGLVACNPLLVAVILVIGVHGQRVGTVPPLPAG